MLFLESQNSQLMSDIVKRKNDKELNKVLNYLDACGNFDS